MIKIIFISLILFCNYSLAQTIQQPIPFLSNALVWLDGKISIVSGDTFFLDKSGNGRNFKITNCDFSINNAQKGWPYKSTATITAPAGDAILIAADADSMFYVNGLPVAIPVTSLFQDINYGHKIFCQHAIKVTDSVSREVYIPKVQQLVFYNTVKNGTDLTKCQIYFNVPTEATSSVFWLSEQGNDVTGTGTKANPYRSISKIAATTNATIYLRSGNYDISTAVTMSGASLVTLIGTGRVSFATRATATGLTNNRPLKIKGCTITANSSTYSILSTKDIEAEFCSITKTDGTTFILAQSGSLNMLFTNCLLNTVVGEGLVYCNTAMTSYKVIGCTGKAYISTLTSPTSLVISYCYLKTGSGVSSSATTTTYNFNTMTGNVSLGGSSNFRYSTLAGNIVATNPVISNCTIAGAVTGSASNYIDSSTIGNGVLGICNSIKNTTVTGMVKVTVVNNSLFKKCTFNAAANLSAVQLLASQYSNITGVGMDSCYVNGNVSNSYLLFIGPKDGSGNPVDGGHSAITGTVVSNCKINNAYVGAGTCHTVALMGGNNNLFHHNEVFVSNGYALVVKSDTLLLYDSTISHVYYNAFRHTGAVNYCILVKGGLRGVVATNNTVTNFTGGGVVFAVDGSTPGSFFCINNLVSLGANTTSLISSQMTSRHNVVNKNGFTMAALTSTDSLTTVSISSAGIPASKIEYGEAASWPNIGLDILSNFPLGIIYKSQPAIWQKGAYIQ